MSILPIGICLMLAKDLCDGAGMLGRHHWFFWELCCYAWPCCGYSNTGEHPSFDKEGIKTLWDKKLMKY
jgi:hypothetical protein